MQRSVGQWRARSGGTFGAARRSLCPAFRRNSYAVHHRRFLKPLCSSETLWKRSYSSQIHGGADGNGGHADGSSSSSSNGSLLGVSNEEVDRARAYCSNLLRQFDHPSHTLRAFVPPHALDAYLALRALNIDVARVADATSNPTVGAMRMQFWRDAVSKALELQPPKEPVALLLGYAAATLAAQTGGRARLSRGWLLRIINTREQHLANPPYPDLAALETYAENTYSTLLYLQLSALPLTSVAADHVASHIGKAQGIAAVLRGLPLLAFPAPPNHHSAATASAAGLQLPSSARQGVVTLPLDVMAAAGLREEEVLRTGAAATGLKDAVFAVATRANDHLITAREMLRNLRAGRDAGHAFEHANDPERQPRQPHTAPDADAGGEAEAEAEAEVEGQGGTERGRDLQRAFPAYMHALATQSWLDRLQRADFDVFAPELRTADWKLPFKAYWAWRKRAF